ncbi:hypothetical protein SAMN05877753_11137 [Bacillus oleivorans]|uniref:Uncharacterized protein n=1 Tax=Bacillus oleivorans TaxID=1448271 RepID=A0A285D727_9BACI|nr:hypothetical protein [Bacillus oleivorans]SNX75156.1 hypothetical protein SAMN05877753_11137 [Bacillus oleivorans]
MSLKTELRSLNIDNDLNLQQINIDNLIEEMLENIGSVDPELEEEEDDE